MIGAKSAASLLLLFLGAALALFLGLFRPEHIARANTEVAFLVGLIAAVAGTFAWRFWRLGERSHHYFRWVTGEMWDDEAHFLGTEGYRIAMGEDQDGDAFELSPRTQYAICLSLAFVLGLGTIDERAWRRLAQWPHTLFAAGSQYCPEEEEKKVEHDPNEPGCALIRRAYELGYAKSLGECAGRQHEGPVKEACYLRQRDEPTLHYAWRLFYRSTERMEYTLDERRIETAEAELDRKKEHVLDLAESHEQVMGDTPRAAHQIFTNLPDPSPGGMSHRDNAFDPLTCVDRYRELPHRPPVDEGPSRVFEHVVGQLLFETRYQPAAGYCREYRVHWGQPVDICKRLAAAPDKVLAEVGGLTMVQAVLERYRLGGELKTVRGAEPSSAQKLEPEQLISFQCYEEGVPPGHTSYKFTVGGFPFHAEDRRAPASPPPEQGGLEVDRYGYVAKMLEPDFNYGALLSDAGVETAVSPGAKLVFSDRSYRLSRLWNLASIDLFLDPQAIAGRDDLLEVYPYHLHLRNYVRIFRTKYRHQRARL